MYMDERIQYPDKWTPIEYACACGTRIRVDCEAILGPFGSQVFQHTCGQDHDHDMPGPIFASYEQRDGDWVLAGKYTR